MKFRRKIFQRKFSATAAKNTSREEPKDHNAANGIKMRFQLLHFPLNLFEAQQPQSFHQRLQQALFVCIQAEQIRQGEKDDAISGDSQKQLGPRIQNDLRLDQQAARHADARNQRKPREIFPEGEDINLFFFLVIDVQYQAFHQKKGDGNGNGVARHAVIFGTDDLPGKAKKRNGKIGVGSKFKVVTRFADVPADLLGLRRSQSDKKDQRNGECFLIAVPCPQKNEFPAEQNKAGKNQRNHQILQATDFQKDVGDFRSGIGPDRQRRNFREKNGVDCCGKMREHAFQLNGYRIDGNHFRTVINAQNKLPREPIDLRNATVQKNEY